MYEPFEETRNGYWTTGDDGKRITDFTLKIQGYSDSYIKGTVEKNGRTREFKAKNTDFLLRTEYLKISDITLEVLNQYRSFGAGF